MNSLKNVFHELFETLGYAYSMAISFTQSSHVQGVLINTPGSRLLIRVHCDIQDYAMNQQQKVQSKCGIPLHKHVPDIFCAKWNKRSETFVCYPLPLCETPLPFKDIVVCTSNCRSPLPPA
ncbi:unnamed protein product [Choristocarpus tenellus]